MFQIKENYTSSTESSNLSSMSNITTKRIGNDLIYGNSNFSNILVLKEDGNVNIIIGTLGLWG